MSEKSNPDFEQEFDERTIDITRVAKVVKGGRRFGFRVTVVVGDRAGQIGFGTGKARTVPDAIRKATERARKDMRRINMYKGTIPHAVEGRVGGAIVLLKPASPGTGVVAGGGTRAVMQAVGIHDVLTKSLGSANILNVVQATMQALDKLKSIEETARIRGKKVEELVPHWERKRG